jgi:hypothetical protein
MAKDEPKELKELQAIKKLLMLDLIKSGATSEELDMATGMGAGNIRREFPAKKIKKYK